MIADYDISCYIPVTFYASFGTFDWFRTSANYSRIVSRAQETLFSASASLLSEEQYSELIINILSDIEAWKESIPSNFSPTKPLRSQNLNGPAALSVALQVNYSYYNLLIVLSRLRLYICAKMGKEQDVESTLSLMVSARSVLELTRLIDLQEHFSTWCGCNS
jgi:hypothetical protein